MGATSTALLPEELEIRRRVVWACYSESVGLSLRLGVLIQQFRTRSSRYTRVGRSASATTECMSRTASWIVTRSWSFGRRCLSRETTITQVHPHGRSAHSPPCALYLSLWSVSSRTSTPRRGHMIGLAAISNGWLLCCTDGEPPFRARSTLIPFRTRTSHRRMSYHCSKPAALVAPGRALTHASSVYYTLVTLLHRPFVEVS